MSDNDLIRRGDALALMRHDPFLIGLREDWAGMAPDEDGDWVSFHALTAIPAVDVAGVRAAALREAAAKAKEIADQYVGYMSRIEKAILALIDTPADDPMADPRVQALVEALRDIRDTGGRFGTVSHMAKVDRIARAALAAFKGDEA